MVEGSGPTLGRQCSLQGGGRICMATEVISTGDAPGAIGPYSQAIKVGTLVFTAGQIPLDPATGKLVEGDISAQTERVLRNLAAILTASGSSLGRVVKTTCFL